MVTGEPIMGMGMRSKRPRFMLGEAGNEMMNIKPIRKERRTPGTIDTSPGFVRPPIEVSPSPFPMPEQLPDWLVNRPPPAPRPSPDWGTIGTSPGLIRPRIEILPSPMRFAHGGDIYASGKAKDIFPTEGDNIGVTPGPVPLPTPEPYKPPPMAPGQLLRQLFSMSPSSYYNLSPSSKSMLFSIGRSLGLPEADARWSIERSWPNAINPASITSAGF